MRHSFKSNEECKLIITELEMGQGYSVTLLLGIILFYIMSSIWLVQSKFHLKTLKCKVKIHDFALNAKYENWKATMHFI